MAKRVSKFCNGYTMVGRILSFDRMKGYGFIRTVGGEDIFLSSYDVPKNTWKRISVGDYVEFVVGNSDRDSIVAKNATIIKKMPRHLSIELPNHEKLETRHIYKYGMNSLLKDGYGKLYPDYPSESFDYVFIETSERTLVFNCHDSPVIIDGEVDIDKFYLHLSDLLMKYEIDRDYENETL